MRIKSLDGIRALAIGLVLATHVLGFRWGWIGVDLFFVLSGFLITGILRKERHSASYWKPFYIKRATRILPPLVIAFLGAALLYHLPWRHYGVLYIFFGANIGEYLARGQFASLGVLWSLAVEEHFYFFWPIAVRLLSRRRLIYLSVAIIFAEPLLRAVVTPYTHSFWFIFFLTPFRLDGLVMGSLLAVLMEDAVWTKRYQPWSMPALLLTTGSFISLCFFPAFDRVANTVVFNSIGYSLISLIGLFLVFAATKRDSAATAILSNPLLAFVGLISYGLYLYHPLVITLVDRFGTAIHFHHNRVLSPLTLAGSLLLAWVSYRLYEEPIMRWGHQKARQVKIEKELDTTTSLASS
ncbi:acyltransferase family protein [Acidipila rosea]|uniref:Peptidoglycan/LPS O-acetylase OafA/YrhL n=1 Tax=Acidipila rosea TaxID=768535 RepID=A0A4R1L1X3_9BACT|nr:acyltransferase [Acidipila rosea]TCK70149.1 peptidoglycan/LPS O-acetylase OafA/YrhL [Acidipila rosea]